MVHYREQEIKVAIQYERNNIDLLYGLQKTVRKFKLVSLHVQALNSKLVLIDTHCIRPLLVVNCVTF